MPRTLWVTLTAIATLAVVGTVVFRAGDRQTLVPPPEAVGEQLLRQLHVHRESRTDQQLSDEVQSQWPPHRLRAWWQQLEQQIGEVDQITGEGNAIDHDRAEARVAVQGRSRSATVVLRMKRERGLWVVAELPPSLE